MGTDLPGSDGAGLYWELWQALCQRPRGELWRLCNESQIRILRTWQEGIRFHAEAEGANGFEQVWGRSVEEVLAKVFALHLTELVWRVQRDTANLRHYGKIPALQGVIDRYLQERA